MVMKNGSLDVALTIAGLAVRAERDEARIRQERADRYSIFSTYGYLPITGITDFACKKLGPAWSGSPAGESGDGIRPEPQPGSEHDHFLSPRPLLRTTSRPTENRIDASPGCERRAHAPCSGTCRRRLRGTAPGGRPGPDQPRSARRTRTEHLARVPRRVATLGCRPIRPPSPRSWPIAPSRGAAPATVRLDRAGIAAAHRHAGVPDPTGYPGCREVLAGLTRRGAGQGRG